MSRPNNAPFRRERLLLALILAAMLPGTVGAQSGDPPPALVGVETVEKATFHPRITLIGRTKARSESRIVAQIIGSTVCRARSRCMSQGRPQHKTSQPRSRSCHHPAVLHC